MPRLSGFGPASCFEFLTLFHQFYVHTFIVVLFVKAAFASRALGGTFGRSAQVIIVVTG